MSRTAAHPGAALRELTWVEAGRVAPESILVVPVGATEQHGPHLPLTTDTDIAAGLAERVRLRRADAVVAPPVAYGSSGEHDGFAGTISVGQAGIELFLVELCRSASLTFERVLLLCAHGGNREPIRRVAEQMRDEGRDVTVFHPVWGIDAHAGRAETSLMLALAPDRVLLNRAAAGAVERIDSLMPRLVADGVAAVSSNGVLGDPAGASAEEGEALLTRALDLLDRVLERGAPA